MTALGHLSTGLLLKGRYPRAPLPLLLMAAAVPDIIWAAFNLLRDPGRAPLEIVQVAHPFTYIGDQRLLLQPWSHGLASTLLMALMLAGLAFLAYRDRQVAVPVGLAVAGHWLLDLLVHDADLPLNPFNPTAVVGPPLVLDPAHPSRGLFSTQPLLGFAFQSAVILGCVLVFLRAYPIAGASGRRRMWLGVLVLTAASLPIFLRGAMTAMIGGSTQLILGAVAEMVVMGLALDGLARWSVGPSLHRGPLETEQAVPFVHRTLTSFGVACLALSATYLWQSAKDAQLAPSIGWTSLAMALLFALAGRALMAKNPSALWFSAALAFVGGPLVRLFSDAGSLGPLLVVMEMGLAAAATWLIVTLLRRNLAL